MGFRPSQGQTNRARLAHLFRRRYPSAVRTSFVAALVLAAAPRDADAPRYVPPDVPVDLRPALASAEDAIRAAACAVEREFGEGDPDVNAARCEGAKDTAPIGEPAA